VLLIAMATALAGTAADSLARLLPLSMLYYRPDEMFLQRLPEMPRVSRFVPGAAYDGESYGDLTELSGDARHREYRRLRFTSDGFGFRNEPGAPSGRALDVILLGDSFGAGSGTSQEKTWAHLLRERHGHALYDLSMPGAGPWQEFAALAMEAPRLPARPGTLVVWALFSGNDLDDEYHDLFDPDALPHRGRLGAAVQSASTFRVRSPVRQRARRAIENLLLGRLDGPDRAIERTLPDGRDALFWATYVARRARTVDAVKRHPSFPALTRTVEAMTRLTRARRLDLAIVVLPSKEEVYSWLLDHQPGPPSTGTPSGFAAAVRELAGRADVPVLDLEPALSREAHRAWEESRALLWWRDDSHWNPRGHAVAAAAVHQLVASRPRRAPSP
jgi:hypothetical protein